MKVSELPGKTLIALSGAENAGYIINVWFDSKLSRAITVEIVNDDDETEMRKFAPLKNMECGGDAAVIRSSACIKEQNQSSAAVPCPVGITCFNQNGKALGKIRDIELSDCVVTEIICDEATFKPAQLLSLGDNCIFNDTGKKISLPKPRPKNAQAGKDKLPKEPPVNAPEAPQNNAAQTYDRRAYAVQTPTVPQSVTVTRTPPPARDYSFLLGKHVHSPVMSRGKVIIPEDAVVDAQIIELARLENKLIQLALRAY